MPTNGITATLQRLIAYFQVTVGNLVSLPPLLTSN